MNIKPLLLPMLIALTLLTACQETMYNLNPQETISGEVYYRERILLPEGAVIKTSLENVSTMTQPPQVIAQSAQKLSGTPPYLFHLQFPTKHLNSQNTYSLRVMIEVDDKLLFSATEHIDPFALEFTTLKLLLQASPSK
ncbi:MAG: YbaY family lipoprotein [Spirochaetales bacterium]|nr:YbaY family lipoprotein [Spirochaetales bacterium]